MTEILATNIHVVANPTFLLCAHTCMETKQTPESKLEFSAHTSHERFPISGPLTVEGSGQSHNIICFKNVWVDKMAGF